MGLAIAAPVFAADDRKVPVSDTEDASVSLQPVGGGRLHPVLGLDLRNGDFVRGAYDDDAAGLGRVPVHAQFGLVYDLRNGSERAPGAWIELRSSNGFHAPDGRERASPRSWYESNNLVGLAARIAPDVVSALTYTVKNSPNAVSDTTHELSAALAWEGKAGLAALRPGFGATWRPKGGGGLYTQLTIAPGIELAASGEGDRLSLPMAIGVGWDGFYAPGSGSRLFGSAGLAYAHPFTLGRAHLALRAEGSALFRDGGLRALDPRSAGRDAVRPSGRLSISYAY